MSELAQKFDAFVVLTKGNVKEWNRLKNIKIIPNPTSFYPSASSHLTTKKVISVGKQGYQKGYDRLLKAWKIVCKTIPDWKLEICGKIEPTENLNALTNELKIQHCVFFHPPTKDIEEKYQEASLYVMSSRFEGFGMVLIEAMACGLPCVAFDCPHGPADIITHQEDGILVPNGNEAELAKALVQLMEDDMLRKQMGQQAKVNVRRYLPELVMPQWDALFKKLVH